MSKLIGTNPNQVPSNADLGTAAFMDKKEFLLSKGSEMSAIEAVIPKTAVDVFIYDTTKDSDGGAWRKRVQHTSWYNERLNTTTRGSRKEFPAVAVIVLQVDRITIYDGDDPSLPMWMTWEGGASGGTLWLIAEPSSGDCTLSSVCMMNSILVYTDNGNAAGLYEVNFIKDSASRFGASGNEDIWVGAIVDRQTPKFFNTFNGPRVAIVNWYANDVAMTVLPNAPIDPDTGLPVPTIAVATNGGVSVIKDDGSVVDGRNTSGDAYEITGTVTFDENNRLWYVQDNSSQRDGYVINIPSSDWTANNGNNLLSGASGWSFSKSGENGNIKFVGTSASDVSHKNIGSDAGVTFTDYTEDQIATVSNSPLPSLFAYVTSTYNTGWMNGDIKLATLSDTDATNVTGTELVTNGTFDTNTSGWTAYGSGSHTFSVVDNKLAVVRGSLGSGNGEPYQALTTVAGQKYVLSLDISGTTMSVVLETSIGSGSLTVTGNYLVGSHGITFTATTTTTYLRFIPDNSNTTSNVDNISVRLAESDRSVNNKGLQVFGTVTKTAVATGADLVAYSGFNTTAGYSPNGNRLQQPYNSGYNFTGDFSISYWVKGNDSDTAIHWSDASGNDGWHIYHNVNTSYFLDGTWDSFSAYQQVNSVTSLTGAWTRVDYVRRGRSLYYYLDAVLKDTYNGIGGWALTNTTAHQLAVYAGNTTNAFALLRISATAPSAEQIAKIYNDEKYLFQENAKATLYGTSDAVTALAYDDDTELLHVGTSAGRSDFQGLRRINNTTRAIGTAISAVDGFIVEE